MSELCVCVLCVCSGCEIECSGAKALSQLLPKLTQLNHLSFRGEWLWVVGEMRVCVVSHMWCVMCNAYRQWHWRLWNNRIVLGIVTFNKTHTLELGSWVIGFVIKCLMSNAYNVVARTGNDISDDGITQLSQALLKLTQLTHLSLYSEWCGCAVWYMCFICDVCGYRQ